jgi:2-dehydropantoate 2-reductase
MLQIDEHARSSMADDLARGRSTEIDALCGAIVRLAEGLNCPAPLNARIAGLIREQSVVPHRYDAARLKEALGIRW